MMNQGTLDLFLGGTSRERAMRPWTPWALGMLLGVVLGSAITGVAVDEVHQAHAASERLAKAPQWQAPALDREWRGVRTPVDVDRMFRSRSR